jgi:peptidoglycan/LPS O-acetylase OafA/YrhL
MKGDRYLALDGLRGIAAVAVVFRHAHVQAAPFLHGYLAVDMFFLLSGFVIAKSYEPRLAEGWLTLGAYMRQRLERLYPMLVLGGLIGLGLWVAGMGETVVDGPRELGLALASQFLLIPFLAFPNFFLFNGAHWSISFELLINFIHAALLPWLSNRVLAGIAGACALWIAFGIHRYGTLDLGWDWPTLAYGFPRVFFGFFLGVLLYRCRDRWQKLLPRLPLAVIGLVLLAVADLPPSLAPHGSLAWQAADLGSALLLMPLLVMLGSVSRSDGPLVTALGTLSFPIYAIHKPIVEALLAAHLPPLLGALGIVATIVLAWLIGVGIDEPLNAWRRAQRRKPPPVGMAMSA